MAVMVKRKGAKVIAVLPEGKDWTIRVWRGRLVALCPTHPPMILGEYGLEEIKLTDTKTQLRITEMPDAG